MLRCLLFLTITMGWLSLAVAQLPTAQDPQDRSWEARIQAAIQAGDLPGCVVVLGDSEKVLIQQAFGNRRVEPVIEPMTVDTVFDLASLTKPLATATSVMLLVQDGQIDPDRPIADYLPEFASNGKQEITIHQALVHQSGLIADNAMADYQDGPQAAWEKIWELKLVDPVGERFRYSDVNYLVLGKLVEQVSGKGLDEFARQRIYQPLEMHDTGYLPGPELIARAAPTERRNGQWICGQVHDPRAFALGGVAGHAGLFSTAADLTRYCQAVLNRHRDSGPSKNGVARFPLKQSTLHDMTRAYTVSRGTRGRGWDKRSPYSSNRCDAFSEQAFGHGGFTGTVLWIDPGTDRFFLFLGNRLHPDGEGSVNRLAAQVCHDLMKSFEK